ncbi:Ig-like domain-containing protein [Citrobacter portucalensis]|uniref:Ig-like domain-containing protein n=1 Tax=Citrobacter portucalensis TaxID=1639133 RepID=UPI0035D0AB16
MARPKLSGEAEPRSIVKVEINGGSYTASVDDDGKWELILPKDPVSGVNNYTVTAEDVAGNVSSTSSGSVTTDTASRHTDRRNSRRYRYRYSR